MAAITMSLTAPLRIPVSGPQFLQDGNSQFAAILAFARVTAKVMLASTSALVDSSTGVAQALNAVIIAPVSVGAAASGSNLADPTTTMAALVTVYSATLELYTKTSAALLKLGVTTAATAITYSGGGTGPTNTMGAITKTVTGATTGAPVVAYNALVALVNTAHYNLALMIDKVATASGTTLVGGPSGIRATWTDTAYAPGAVVAAFPVTLGSAVSPGVLQTEAVATLTQFANNIATFGATLNAALVGVTVAPIVVIV